MWAFGWFSAHKPSVLSACHKSLLWVSDEKKKERTCVSRYFPDTAFIFQWALNVKMTCSTSDFFCCESLQLCHHLDVQVKENEERILSLSLSPRTLTCAIYVKSLLKVRNSSCERIFFVHGRLLLLPADREFPLAGRNVLKGRLWGVHLNKKCKVQKTWQ